MKKGQTRGGFPVGVWIDQEDAWLGLRFTWHINKRGYVCTFVRDGDKHYCLLLHRAIMWPQPDEHVDHIFHNKLDNRRAMLRCSSPSRNNFNRKGAQANTSTGERNVYRRKDGSFSVDVRYRGKRFRSQRKYQTIELASAVASELRKQAQDAIYA